MMRKVAVLAIVLCLLTQTALAADPIRTGVVTPHQPLRYAIKGIIEGFRVTVTINPARRVALLMRHAAERLRELEALSESDPEAFRERVLMRHEQIVQRANAIISNRDNLPEQIVSDLMATQLRALEAATNLVKAAKDPALAEKRLDLLKARQELTLAIIEKNAERIAENQISRAEAILNNATETQARINNGEGMEVIRERYAQILRRAQERRNTWLRNKQDK